MKSSFKKIISLVLTVLMLVGTVTMLVPITASATDSYTEITKNTDFVHNGITYRFDVRDGNTNSYARIMADGSIEIKYSYGDILWFPEIKMTDTSAMHAEVTAIAHDSDTSGMGNTFMGIVYGATEKADGSFNTGIAGILRTAGRARITVISRENLTNKNGGDHGNGGGTKIYNVDDSFKDHANYASVKSSNNDWGFNKTIKFDVSRAGNNVTFAMSSAAGEFFTKSYDTASYAYAGAIGWTSVWANNAGYKTYRFDKLTLTNCTVNGEAKDTYTAFERKEASEEPVDPPSDIIKEVITGKTDVKINDITMRMDYPTPSHASASLTLCSDGSVIIKGNRGDLFWMPNVEITENSVITTTVKMDSASDPLKASAGTIFNVDANGAWDAAADTAIIAALRPYNGNSRRSLGAISYQSSTNSADYTKILSEVNYTPTNTNFGNSWALGASVTTTISKKTDGTVEAVFTDSNGDFIIDASYNDAQYPFEGAVGYMTHWSNSSDYYQYIISEYTITNALVNGELVEEFDLMSEVRKYFGTETPDEPELPEAPEGTVYLEKNKTATYNGITYRFDTNKENDNDSWVRVNADGSWEINIRNGDMLWFPDVKLTDKSEVYMEVTKTGTNTSDYFPGLAYGVTSSTGSTWTSTNVSVLRTYQNEKMRFRATSITRANAIKVSGSDYGNGGDARPFNNEFAATALWDLIANPTNKNWDIGKTVYHKVSQTSDNVVLEYGVPSQKAAFVDPANTSYANNYEGMYAVAGGSVGYTMVWQGNDTAHSQFRIEDITVTNCKVGGVDKASYSVKALAPTVDKEAKISLSLDGTIGLNFSINANNLKDATIVAKKNGVELVNQAVVEGENLVTVPVNAKEMTDTINVAIMQNGEVFGGHSYTTSVSEYAEQLLNDEEWGDLMSAMLNYGAAAQKLLDYKADEADVSGVADYDFTAVNDVDFGDGSIKDVLKGLYMNLDLESNTVLNLYFMPVDGTALTVTVNGIEAVPVDNGDGYYVVSTEGIAADKLGEDITIVVNGTYIFKVNALNWAKIASSDADADVATLADALAAYASCAKEIFEKK